MCETYILSFTEKRPSPERQKACCGEGEVFTRQLQPSSNGFKLHCWCCAHPRRGKTLSDDLLVKGYEYVSIYLYTLYMNRNKQEQAEARTTTFAGHSQCQASGGVFPGSLTRRLSMFPTQDHDLPCGHSLFGGLSPYRRQGIVALPRRRCRVPPAQQSSASSRRPLLRIIWRQRHQGPLNLKDSSG